MKVFSLFKNSLVPFLVVALIAGAFLIGSLYTKVQLLEKGGATGAGTQTGANPQAQAAPNVNIKDVDIKDEPFIGKEDAPVTMAYWFDFQCPFCKQFETNVLPTLIEKYVNTGKLKIVFKDFQFLGADSQTAGLAENAVWELYPQNYLKFNQTMYEKQGGENSGWASKNNLIAIVSSLGMDGGKISQLMDSKKDAYQKELDGDKTEGGKFGVSGTPGFVIGTQSIQGAEPLNVFTQVIDAELGKK